MAIPRPRYNQKKKRRLGPGKKFKRGFFQPLNEGKYVQPADRTMNSSALPEYRSSWELGFMKYCDQNTDILQWSTESVAIPYVKPTDGKIHRYFPDFFIVFRDGRKLVVEIKPEKQKTMPINQSKWEAAEAFCKKIGAVFVVLSEVELKKFGIINK